MNREREKQVSRFREIDRLPDLQREIDCPPEIRGLPPLHLPSKTIIAQQGPKCVVSSKIQLWYLLAGPNQLSNWAPHLKNRCEQSSSFLMHITQSVNMSRNNLLQNTCIMRHLLKRSLPKIYTYSEIFCVPVSVHT